MMDSTKLSDLPEAKRLEVEAHLQRREATKKARQILIQADHQIKAIEEMLENQ